MDIAYLDKLWKSLQKQAKGLSDPVLLYQELDLSLRVLRDFINLETTRVMIDSRETHYRMNAFAHDYIASSIDKLEHYAGQRPLFDLYGVEEEIEKALTRRVDL